MPFIPGRSWNRDFALKSTETKLADGEFATQGFDPFSHADEAVALRSLSPVPSPSSPSRMVNLRPVVEIDHDPPGGRMPIISLERSISRVGLD